MNMGKHLSVVLVSVISSLFIMATHVEARSYSFSVDRFQVFGNLPNGNFDEFNDGVLDPWTIQGGTAVESSDVLTLSNPGQVENFLQNNLEVTQERSSVEVSATTGAFAVAEGSGDFTVESRWLPVLPDLNLSYGMTFHYPPTEFDQVRIGIDNIDALNLSLLGAPEGMLPGSYISFLQISPQPGMGLLNLSFEYQAVPVAAEDITGDIVFQLIFNDATDSFSAAFSLDGGSTFTQPFSPFSIPSLSGSIDPFVELEVISKTVRPVPVPPTLILLGSGLAGLAIFGRKRLFKEV